MKIIDSSIVIFNYLYQSDKDKIDIKEIIDYAKMIEKKISKENYIIEKIDYKEIIKFANYYSIYILVENNTIIIRNLSKLKHIVEKYKLNEVDEKIKLIFIKPDKYTFPLLVNNNLVLYEMASTDGLLKNNKENFYLTSKDTYLLNLDILINNEKINNIELFISKLFMESESIKTNHFNYNTVLEYIKSVELLTSNAYNSIINYLGNLENTKKVQEKTIEILEYIKIANINISYLSEESALYKKISNKHK